MCDIVLKQHRYRSRIHYIGAGVSNLALGKYLFHSAGFDAYGIASDLARVVLTPGGSNTVGPQDQDEQIVLMGLQTSSGRPAGSDEFVVESYGFRTTTTLHSWDLTSKPCAGLQANTCKDLEGCEFDNDQQVCKVPSFGGVRNVDLSSDTTTVDAVIATIAAASVANDGIAVDENTAVGQITIGIPIPEGSDCEALNTAENKASPSFSIFVCGVVEFSRGAREGSNGSGSGNGR